MAKKQTIVTAPKVIEPPASLPIELPIELPVAPEPVKVPVAVLPVRTTATVRLREGYTQCRSAGVVFGPDPMKFALDDYRLPEFRACKYLEVDK